MYVEVRGKICYFHLKDREIAVRFRLSDVEELIGDKGFLKPHRSFLVNAAQVFTVGRRFIELDDGTEIPLSRNRAYDIMVEFMNYVQEN